MARRTGSAKYIESVEQRTAEKEIGTAILNRITIISAREQIEHQLEKLSCEELRILC